MAELPQFLARYTNDAAYTGTSLKPFMDFGGDQENTTAGKGMALEGQMDASPNEASR
jgi:hypothetical protein